MVSPWIWHHREQVPPDLNTTAVTIGNFDGVHLGHHAVLDATKTAARKHGLVPIALTFWPHPRHVMGTPGVPELITGQTDRNRLLLAAGMQGVLDVRFTREFAQLSPEQFVRDYLCESLRAQCVVLGEDARFGHQNSGTIDTMRELGRAWGFEVVTVPDRVDPDDHAGPRISSSSIRAALFSGDIASASRMLGRYHVVTDTVHHGAKRGRDLGFPTANLGAAPDGLIPADGVYAGLITVVEQAPGHTAAKLDRAPCTISIGTNPTFHRDATSGQTMPAASTIEPMAAPRTVEAYVHGDHTLDLYGDTVRLEFVQFQRPTVTFESTNELIEHMHADVDVSRHTLSAAGLLPSRPS